jgi:glycosyltransferase involved in cell wall biosynthesis
MREFAPEIAHGLDARSSALAAVAGRIAGVPVLIGSLREHGDRPPWRLRAALRRLDRVTVPSEALRAEAARFLREPVVVPPGIDPAEVRGVARAPEFSEPRHRLATIAHLVEGRGIEALIEAAAIVRERLPDLEWLVIGTGARALRHLRTVQSCGLDQTVRLLGDREDVGAVLASVDAYVQPGGREAIPRGLLLALAAGLPCVAARNPSIEALLEDGRDAVLASGEARGLAESVASVLSPDGQPLRAAARSRGPAIAASFSADHAAFAVAALHDAAIRDARARAGRA